jgi:hypothetical protein
MPTLLIVLAVLAWLFLATRTLWAANLMPTPKWLQQRFQKLGKPTLVLMTFALICLLFGLRIGWEEYKKGADLSSNIAIELISIAVTIIVLDRMNEWRSQYHYKKSIIQQMGSQSNDFALDAARIAKNEGWLSDGSFQGANLSFANLQRAKLFGANLHGASLSGANLHGAVLREAKYNSKTVWPDGFNYVDAGAIEIED